MLQGRIPFAMAQGHFFWSPMAKVHSRCGAPYLALIFASVLTMVIQLLIPNFRPTVALIASITALVRLGLGVIVPFWMFGVIVPAIIAVIGSTAIGILLLILIVAAIIGVN